MEAIGNMVMMFGILVVGFSISNIVMFAIVIDKLNEIQRGSSKGSDTR